MEQVDRLAARLDTAAAVVEGAAAGINGLWHDASAFGADAPGLPGEVGRALYGQWTAALYDREREARRAATLLVDTAAALRRAAPAYASTDETAAGTVTAAYPADGAAPAGARAGGDVPFGAAGSSVAGDVVRVCAGGGASTAGADVPFGTAGSPEPGDLVRVRPAGTATGGVRAGPEPGSAGREP